MPNGDDIFYGVMHEAAEESDEQFVVDDYFDSEAKAEQYAKLAAFRTPGLRYYIFEVKRRVTVMNCEFCKLNDLPF